MADWISKYVMMLKVASTTTADWRDYRTKTANRWDDIIADIRSRAWGWQQSALFMDVKAFHPNATSYHNTTMPALYRRYEQEKMREYGNRVRENEFASLTSLVFTTTGGNQLGKMLPTAQLWRGCATPYISFAILRSAVMCMHNMCLMPALSWESLIYSRLALCT